MHEAFGPLAGPCKSAMMAVIITRVPRPTMASGVMARKTNQAGYNASLDHITKARGQRQQLHQQGTNSHDAPDHFQLYCRKITARYLRAKWKRG